MRRCAVLLTLLVALLTTTGCTAIWGKSTPAPPPPESTPIATPTPQTPPAAPTLPLSAPDPNHPPTISETDSVAIGLPSNDCLNLRSDHSTHALVAACLPGGTKLTVALPAQGPHLDWAEGDWWLYVKTDKGDKGWVAMTAGQIKRNPS